MPSRVMPTMPNPGLTGVPVRGGALSTVPTTGLTAIRPGGVPTLTTPGVTTPGITTPGVSLGTTNGLNPVRPSILTPGTIPGTGTVNPGIVTGGTMPVRPGGTGIITTPGVVNPGIVSPGVIAPTQQQGTFLDRVLGPDSQLQVSPNGIQVGPSAPGGYQQPQIYPNRTTPGVMPGAVPGVVPGLGTPNGTCRPQNNGLIGFFDNTVGAAVKRMLGMRDNCWGPTATQGVPGVGVDPRSMVQQPGTMMPQTTVPGAVRGLPTVPNPGVVSPGVQLTRPMSPRSF